MKQPETATAEMARNAEGMEVLLHASAIGWDGKALVFTGPSGSGKSTLCLSLMAYGAELIADDRVVVRRMEGKLRVFSPPQLGGMVEARGLGLLGAAPPISDQGYDLTAIVRLDRVEPDRLPSPHEGEILGLPTQEIWRVEGPQFAPGLLQMLKHGRVA